MSLKELKYILTNKKMCFLKRIWVVLVLSIFCLSCVEIYAQSEATLQAEAWFKEANKKMEQSYNEVLKAIQHSVLPQNTKKILTENFRSSQKSWIEYRRKEASSRACFTAQGGSAYSMDYLANLAELTEERTKIFSRFIDQVK